MLTDAPQLDRLHLYWTDYFIYGFGGTASEVLVEVDPAFTSYLQPQQEEEDDGGGNDAVVVDRWSKLLEHYPCTCDQVDSKVYKMVHRVLFDLFYQ